MFEEVLSSAMEDFRGYVIIGQGAGAKSVNCPLTPVYGYWCVQQKVAKFLVPLRSPFCNV